MDGLDLPIRRRKTLQERLGFKGMGCCAASWAGFRPTTIDDDDLEPPQQQQPQREQNQDQAVRIIDLGESTPERASDPECVALSPAGSGMNLAAALAAERHLRGSQEAEESVNMNSGGSAPGTPLRMSLLRLLAETTEGGEGGAEEGSDMVCCVCMGRKKGAAFIPCGHTFCRVCSRELWLNRGCCPICNRQILEILDIF